MLSCELVEKHDFPVQLEFDIDQFKDNKGRWFDFLYRCARQPRLTVTFSHEGDMFVAHIMNGVILWVDWTMPDGRKTRFNEDIVDTVDSDVLATILSKLK